jgi:hypothetical protein
MKIRIETVGQLFIVVSLVNSTTFTLISSFSSYAMFVCHVLC